VRLRNLDLNLLVALDALLAERSVTEAARRVGGSQPAMSTALARLRRHFADDLLVRVGNHYELSPLAQQLRGPLSQVINGAERVFASLSDFDPTTSDRQFTVMSSDYGMTLVGPALHQAMRTRGAGLRLRLLPLTREALETFPDVLRHVDVLLLPHGIVRGAPHLDLMEDEWVAVLDPQNKLVNDALTLRDLGELPWIVTAAAPPGATTALESTPAVRQLELLGVRPRISVSTESFVTAIALTERTDCIAVAQRKLVERVVPDRTRLRIMELPFLAVPLVQAAWWHPIHERDGGHRWLRHRLGQAAAALA